MDRRIHRLNAVGESPESLTAEVERLRREHPGQVADVISCLVAEIDRDILAGQHLPGPEGWPR